MKKLIAAIVAVLALSGCATAAEKQHDRTNRITELCSSDPNPAACERETGEIADMIDDAL